MITFCYSEMDLIKVQKIAGVTVVKLSSEIEIERIAIAIERIAIERIAIQLLLPIKISGIKIIFP